MHPFAEVLSHLWSKGSVSFEVFATAWHDLVHDRVAKLCRRDRCDADEIHDITHQVLETVYLRSDRGQIPARLAPAYVFKEAHFAVLDHRSQRRTSLGSADQPIVVSLDQPVEDDDELTFGASLSAPGPLPGAALEFDDALGAAYRGIPNWADRASLVLRTHYQCPTDLIGQIVGKDSPDSIYSAARRARSHLPTLGHFGTDPLFALLFEDQLRATEHGESRQQISVETLTPDPADRQPARLPIAPRPAPIVRADGELRFRVKIPHPEIARAVTAIVHLRLADGEVRVHEPLPVGWEDTDGPVWTGRLLVDADLAAATVERMYLFQGPWLLGGGLVDRSA